MDSIVSINNLTFRYKDTFIFDKFSLNVKGGEWISIVGANGSGKSTLLKILTGLILTDNDIKICNINLNKENLREIRKNIGVVFDNVDNSFLTESVETELAFTLENLCYSRKDIYNRISEIRKTLKIDTLFNKSPNDLSGGEKCKLALAVAIMHKPKILIIDETLSMIDEESKDEILKYLSDMHKNGMTIINVTHDLRETYYSDRLIVLNKGEVLLDGKPLKVMEYDRILNKVGISIPFEIDLSIKLKLYGLIDKIYTNTSELVNDIWE